MDSRAPVTRVRDGCAWRIGYDAEVEWIRDGTLDHQGDHVGEPRATRNARIAMAAARSNRVFVACCDRTGTERGQEWTAGWIADVFGV